MIEVFGLSVSNRDAILIAWIPFFAAAGRRWLLWLDSRGPAVEPPAIFREPEPTVPLDDDQDQAATDA